MSERILKLNKEDFNYLRSLISCYSNHDDIIRFNSILFTAEETILSNFNDYRLGYRDGFKDHAQMTKGPI